MKRKLGMAALLIALVSVGLVAASFVLVPHSIRLYMASIATCHDLDDALITSADPQFEGTKFWEVPLAKLYRLKYWHHGGPTAVDDWAGGESNVFIVFLTAADGADGKCDLEILELQQRYLDGSRSLDDYDVTGYTALHQAIILHKTDFVRAYLKGGANRLLAVRSDNETTNNKNAVELAVTIADFEFGPPSSDQIAEMLLTSD